MLSGFPARLLPLALAGLSPLAGVAQGFGTSTLPATPSTSLPTQQAAPLTATAPVRDAATRAHRAEVTYASGLMTVNAQNSSLNAILREISRQTGMKITGGVREDRVFGHYGPATPSDILATLLGGTGTNMLLKQTAASDPLELVLTPRAGGPTPPNPNAPGFNDDANSDDEERPNQRPQQQQSPVAGPTQPVNLAPQSVTAPPSSVVQPANNVLGDPRNTTPTASQIPTVTSVPTDTLPTPSTTTQTVPGIVDTPNQPGAGTVNPAATPSGSAKTPEQIFQELQQLRQQQQKAASPQ